VSALTPDSSHGEVLLAYLERLHEAVLWKVEGLPERDQRMPMTATGTNLLGVVKHLAVVEAEYLGLCVGRPFPEQIAWAGDDLEDNADMWATADEPAQMILDLYRRVGEHSARTVAALPLDAPARVPWWDPQETTLQRVLVHQITETARHAGQMDVVRESIDGARGMLPEAPNLPGGDERWWTAYVTRLREVAERF
jgi:uncharacterized damage-inducible protein DinB